METLRKGSRNKSVKELQKLLHLIPDGIFGSLTEEAVKAFQKENGLTVDGIVGLATWATLHHLESMLPNGLVKSKRKITKLIVHCTATKEGMDYTVNDIRRWHKQQGWSDIGYHYVVYRNGEVHNGRNVNLVGSHVAGYNTGSIGIVYIGGIASDGRTAKDTRTPEQKDALMKLLKDLRKIYPEAGIFGHRDFAKKDCPSFDAKNEYSSI